MAPAKNLCWLASSEQVLAAMARYHGAAMVISAIDAMATLLTGQRYYFPVDGSAPSERSQQGGDDAHLPDNGEKPWPT